MTLKEKADKIRLKLSTAYPDVKTQLDFKTPFQLLVATILSAQCTDKQVNQVTPGLFRQLTSPQDFAEADIQTIEKLIRPTGFYHNKARNLRLCAEMLVNRFHGRVPDTLEELVQLAGVGRKTANVVLGAAFGKPGIVVDTHVARISRRLGLTRNQSPEKIERDLMALIPQKAWNVFCLHLIYFGREICNARKPKCPSCPLLCLCPFEAKTPVTDTLRRLGKNEEIMDVRQLASRLGLEENDIYEVLALFIQTAPSDLAKLSAATSCQDSVQTGEAAHSLKGSTGTLGFLDISTQAQQIMTLSRQKRFEDLSRSVPPFLVRMNDLLKEIQQALDNR
jgi:endonuclease III